MASANDRLRRQVDHLLDEAEQAAGEADWHLVKAKVTHILILDPESQEAAAFAATAERGLAGPDDAAPAPRPILTLGGRIRRGMAGTARVARRGFIPVMLIGLIAFLGADRAWIHWYVPTSQSVAKDFLGEWERNVVQNPPGPVDSDTPEESAAVENSLAQMRSALFRMANASAVLLVDTEGLTPQGTVDKLHGCMEYLLARTGLGAPCNMGLVRAE